jgi:nitroreductase
MLGFLSNLSPENIATWSAKQAYIALGNLMAVAAELQIDACPME